MVYFSFGSDVMKDTYCFVAIAVAFIVFVVIHKISKNKKPVFRAFLSILTGIFTLIAVNMTGIYTGVSLPYSMFTITVSAIGGIPGVTALLGLNLFF